MEDNADLGHQEDDGEVGHGGRVDESQVRSEVLRSKGAPNGGTEDGVGAGEDQVEEDHDDGPQRPDLGAVDLEELEEGEGGDGETDDDTDDDNTFLVSDLVVDETPDDSADLGEYQVKLWTSQPASGTHPVTDVGHDPDVGVEAVGCDEEQPVGLLPVDEETLSHTHGKEPKPDLEIKTLLLA